MMLPVAGAAVIAMPAASSTRATARITYGVSMPTRLNTAMPSPTRKRPRAIVAPVADALGEPALRGETTMNVAAMGSVAEAGVERGVAPDELQVEREQEEEPEHHEEGRP